MTDKRTDRLAELLYTAIDIAFCIAFLSRRALKIKKKINRTSTTLYIAHMFKNTYERKLWLATIVHEYH